MLTRSSILKYDFFNPKQIPLMIFFFRHGDQKESRRKANIHKAN